MARRKPMFSARYHAADGVALAGEALEAALRERGAKPSATAPTDPRLEAIEQAFIAGCRAEAATHIRLFSSSAAAQIEARAVADLTAAYGTALQKPAIGKPIVSADAP